MEKHCKRCGITHSNWRYREEKGYYDCNSCRRTYGRKNKFLNNLKEYGIYTCEVCKITNNNKGFFDIDHIVPKSLGGKNTQDNLQIICPNCHRIKSLKEESVRNDLYAYWLEWQYMV